MSIGTFRIVDPDNLATVLFDMNDIAGTAGNAGGVKTQARELRLNAPELRAVRFSPEGSPGASTPFAKDEPAGMSWRQRIFDYADTDRAEEGLGRLGHLLRLGGVIEWLPTGAALTKYIDFETSPSVPLFGETERDVFYATQLKDYPEGILIQVLRQPYLRSAELDPAVNILANPTLLLDTGLDGRPDSWVWNTTLNITAEAIDAAEEAYRFIIATDTVRDLLQETGAGSAAPGDVWTLSFYAKATATAKARAGITYLDAADVGLTTSLGPVVTLTPVWQRLTVTTPAAPANTDEIRALLRMDNDDSVSVTVYFRFAQLEKASAGGLFRGKAETVSNDPAAPVGRVVPLHVEGTGPAPVKVRAKAEAGAKLRDILIASAPSDGIVGRRALTDFLNSLSYAQCEATGNGWTVALSGDTSSVADAAASGGNVAETSYAANATIMAKRARLSRTSKLAALRGTFDVYVRAKVVAASKHTVQLRWTPSLADPVAFSELEVTLDKTGLTLFQYELVRLGTVHLPHNLAGQVALAGIALELWSRRESGSGALRWDFIAFVPTSGQQARLIVPGGSEEKWLGKDYATPPYKLTADPTWVAGEVSGAALVLNALNEGGGTPPNAGLPWAVGRHRLTFEVQPQTLFNGTFKHRVVNVTGGSGAGSVEVEKEFTINGHPQQFTTLEFDSAASQVYQAQTVVTARTSGRITCSRIIHEFIPYLQGGEQAQGDPARLAAEKLDSAGSLLDFLHLAGGVPLGWLEPGLHLVVFDFADIPQEGQSQGESVLTRAPAISFPYSPRWRA